MGTRAEDDYRRRVHEGMVRDYSSSAAERHRAEMLRQGTVRQGLARRQRLRKALRPSRFRGF